MNTFIKPKQEDEKLRKQVGHINLYLRVKNYNKWSKSSEVTV